MSKCEELSDVFSSLSRGGVDRTDAFAGSGVGEDEHLDWGTWLGAFLKMHWEAKIMEILLPKNKNALIFFPSFH